MDPGDGHRQRRRPRLLLSVYILFLILMTLLPPPILFINLSGESGVEEQAWRSASPHWRKLRPLTIPPEPRRCLLGDSQAREPISIPLVAVSRFRPPPCSAELRPRYSYFTETETLARSGFENQVLSKRKIRSENLFESFYGLGSSLTRFRYETMSCFRSPPLSAKLRPHYSLFTETEKFARGFENHALSGRKVKSDEISESFNGLCSSINRIRYGTLFSSTRCIAFIFGSVRLWLASTMTTRSSYGNRCFTSLNPRSVSWFYRKKAGCFTGPYVSDLSSEPSFEETISVLHSRYVATNFVDGVGLANTPEPNRKQDDFQVAARRFKRKLGQHQCLLGFGPNFASALLISRMGFGPSSIITHKKINRRKTGFRKISFGLLRILKNYLICFMGCCDVLNQVKGFYKNPNVMAL